MIARVLIVGWLLASFALAADERSDLRISGPIEGPSNRIFTIRLADHKHVIAFVKNGVVSTLDVTAYFPYSVTLTESTTPRYKAIILFEDRRNDRTVDTFGLTPANVLERTDDGTHKALSESAAKARAVGEKLGEQQH